MLVGFAVGLLRFTEVRAIRANDFLNSIGTQSAISARGEVFAQTLACCKYLGVRWLRSGIEGNVPADQLLSIHRETGIRFSWGLGSGSTDLKTLLTTSRPLAEAGALLAFEGPNEPNNWAINYGGGSNAKGGSWASVANLQRDLYRSVKSDALLKRYPVWTISEPGAETDNVGLQFLQIPPGTDAAFPAGTRYADFANVHNYIYHPNSPGLDDNKTWNAADPSSACKVDGLFGEFGSTWARHFPGYSGAALASLPRVTTETGCTIDGPVTEKIHALNLLSLYLDQFARGWSYTANYLLRDRVDEGGNQQFGFYTPSYRPRLAATYLHNLTTILADTAAPFSPGSLSFSTSELPATVHELVLQKHDGHYFLAIWDERVTGSDLVTVRWPSAFRAVGVFDPTVGKDPAPAKAEGPMEITLSDHPLVLEFKKKGQGG